MKDTSYIHVDRLSDEELSELLDRLLAGDETAIPEIAKSFIPFAMAIARSYSYKYPHRRKDIQGAALHGLTEAVTRFQTKGYDKNISPYIARKVHSYIQDFIARDHAVRIPSSTYHRHGSEIEVYTSSLSTMTRESMDPDNPMCGVDRSQQEYDIPDHHAPEYEFQALIDELGLDQREATTLDMLLKGFSRKEIATALGVSRALVENSFIMTIKKRCRDIGLCKSIFRTPKSPAKKVCQKCQVEKSVSEFRKYEGKWYAKVCKECTKK